MYYEGSDGRDGCSSQEAMLKCRKGKESVEHTISYASSLPIYQILTKWHEVESAGSN